MPEVIRFGVYELDLEAHELRRAGRLVRLPPQAFRLLVVMVSAHGDVVSRDQLRSALWPDTIHVDFERSLNSAIRKLRAALHDEADHPRYVQTLHGQGYRFIAPVQQLSSTELSHPVSASSVGVPQRRHLRSVGMHRLAAAAVTVCVIALTLAVWSVSRDRRLPVAIRVAHARDAAVAATASGPALDAYRDGQAITGYRLSELSRAIESFETAVRLDPRFAPAWASLARARASRALLDTLDRPELRLARTEAQRALALDHALADAHLALGLVRFGLDLDPAAAEVDLRQARALGASSGRDLFWLVWVLKVEGRTASALSLVQDILVTEANNAELHSWRGLLLHDARRYDEETTELQRALAIDEDSWMVMLQVGLSHSRRREYDRALPALRRAVALSDGSGLTLAWLGRISADAGDLASAQQTRREIGPTRGLNPSTAASIEYQLAAWRTRQSP